MTRIIHKSSPSVFPESNGIFPVTAPRTDTRETFYHEKAFLYQTPFCSYTSQPSAYTSWAPDPPAHTLDMLGSRWVINHLESGMMKFLGLGNDFFVRLNGFRWSLKALKEKPWIPCWSYPGQAPHISQANRYPSKGISEQRSPKGLNISLALHSYHTTHKTRAMQHTSVLIAFQP